MLHRSHCLFPSTLSKINKMGASVTLHLSVKKPFTTQPLTLFMLFCQTWVDGTCCCPDPWCSHYPTTFSGYLLSLSTLYITLANPSVSRPLPVMAWPHWAAPYLHSFFPHHVKVLVGLSGKPSSVNLKYMNNRWTQYTQSHTKRFELKFHTLSKSL